MANVQPIYYEESSGRLRELYDDIRTARGSDILPNWALYLGHAPNVLESVWRMARSTEQSTLSPLLTQLLLFAVSVANSADYCAEYHGSLILKLDNNLNNTDLLQLVIGKSPSIIPNSFKVAIDVASAQVARKCHLPPEEADRLRQAGFDNSQCLEIFGVIALGMMLNAYTMAADIPIDTEFQIPGFSI